MSLRNAVSLTGRRQPRDSSKSVPRKTMLITRSNIALTKDLVICSATKCPYVCAWMTQPELVEILPIILPICAPMLPPMRFPKSPPSQPPSLDMAPWAYRKPTYFMNALNEFVGKRIVPAFRVVPKIEAMDCSWLDLINVWELPTCGSPVTAFLVCGDLMPGEEISSAAALLAWDSAWAALSANQSSQKAGFDSGEPSL